MKSLFEPAVRKELLDRVQNLQLNSERKFGTMRPDQSLHHINLMLETALGKTSATYHGNNVLAGIMRLFLFSPLPIPPGKAKAPKELVAEGTYDLNQEKSNFSTILDRIAANEHQKSWPVHPIFGKLTGKQYGLYGYKEADHHLKQFSV